MAKLSDRSAIRKKVVFFAGSVWSWPRSEGEVGRDQEPPGDTWRHPMGSKIFLLLGQGQHDPAKKPTFLRMAYLSDNFATGFEPARFFVKHSQ